MIKARTLKRTGKKVYDVRLRDPSGKVYTRTFAKKGEAVAYEADERSARRRGAWIDPKGPATPLKALPDLWLTSNPSKRPRTIEYDRAVVTAAVVSLGRTRPLGSVTRADVQKLVDTWKADHAPSTVRRMFSALRAMFSYAEAAEFIVRSPCRHIRLPAAELVERPSTLNADQLRTIADGLADHAAMIYLAAVQGMRWAEVAGLTVGDIDFLGGTISVSGQLGRDRVRATPKSAAGVRCCAAAQGLLDALAAHLATRGLTAADDEALVFVNHSDGPLNYSAWRRSRWVPACKAAGLPALRFHDLRSVNASAMVAEGVDVKTGQHRLGHANAGTLFLQVYARPTAEADRRAADLLWERFRPRDRRAMTRKASR